MKKIFFSILIIMTILRSSFSEPRENVMPEEIAGTIALFGIGGKLFGTLIGIKTCDSIGDDAGAMLLPLGICGE